MNIVREDVDALNAILKVQISPEDYKDKVKSSLEKYRKTAKIPGFRPGHVPFGIIQKQYGKAVLAEELDKITNESVSKFLQENNIDILGNPIPKLENGSNGSFDDPADFEFVFEIGLTPTFELPDFSKMETEFVSVAVDDTFITNHINDLRRRYGKLSSSEVVGESDMVLGKFQTQNEDGTLAEGGIDHSTTISLEFIKNDAGKQQLIGKKVGEVLALDLNLLAENDEDKAGYLGVKAEDLATVSGDLKFTITDIKHMEPADLNEDFFGRLFPDNIVTNEEQMREHIAADLKKHFGKDAESVYRIKTIDSILDNLQLEFPVEFLRKWMVMTQNVKESEVDASLENNLKGLKWQLFQFKVMKENDINVGFEQTIDLAKAYVVDNYSRYGFPAPEDEELQKLAMDLLKDREKINYFHSQASEIAIGNYLKSTCKIVEKTMSYEDFLKYAQ